MNQCTCKIEWDAEQFWHIVYCPMHKNAPALLEACKLERDGKMKKQIASHYWRALLLATGEDEVFSSLRDARAWIERANHVFQRTMDAEIREIKEWIIID